MISKRVFTILSSVFLIICFTIISYSCQSIKQKEVKKDNLTVLNIWFDAVEKSDTNTMKKMLKNNFPINSVGKRSEGFDYEFTALMLSSSFGDVNTVRFLIDNKADINYKTMQGSALLTAVDNSQKDIAYILLSKKANPNITAIDGRTALMAASSKGDYDIVYALLEAGADKTLKHSSGSTALDYAKKGGYTNIVRLLKIN